MKKISFVVAVYRNAGAITKTYQKIKGVFAQDLLDYDYEFVFVDDGSDDGSLEEILALREQDDRVKAITFTRNFGQMAAMLAGLTHASGDAAINISADLQDPADLIPQMVSKWVTGWRSSSVIAPTAPTRWRRSCSPGSRTAPCAFPSRRFRPEVSTSC